MRYTIRTGKSCGKCGKDDWIVYSGHNRCKCGQMLWIESAFTPANGRQFKYRQGEKLPENYQGWQYATE